MKVKICGVTHPEDAEHAACAGADYIGMIFSGRSKRRVEVQLAKNIAERARSCGAEPVGVFVEQTVDEIISICRQTGVKTVQLHGAYSQSAVEELSGDHSIIFAVSVGKDGSVPRMNALPAPVITLYDHSIGGTGIPFDWKAFVPPTNRCWILAGGLNSENVAEAIARLRPSGVDVASGVEYPNAARKDPALVKAFIRAVRILEETQ